MSKEKDMVQRGLIYRVCGEAGSWQVVDEKNGYVSMMNLNFGEASCNLVVRKDADVVMNMIVANGYETFFSLDEIFEDENLVKELENFTKS